MLQVTPQAREWILQQKTSIYLEIPPLIGCCIHLQESPSVRRGRPHDLSGYSQRMLDDVCVYVPQDLPQVPLTIALTSFLGVKRLVIEGWRLA